MPASQRFEKKNIQLAIKLAGVAAAFSVLGFAMVPLYDVICRITGINGKTNTQAVAMPANTQVDTSRWVTVQFLSHTLPGSGLVFTPEQFSVKVHPGEMVVANYVVENVTSQTFRGQAIPSVTPAVGASYLQKIDCFCFKQQSFAPNEKRVLPVVFYIRNEIGTDLSTLTLSYTFFEAVSEQANATAINPHPLNL